MMKKQNQEIADSNHSNQPVSSQSDDADESRWVWCDYCDTDLELDDDEIGQGWYSCPECGQISHIADAFGRAVHTLLETPARDDVEWVQLVEHAGAEEAALVVSYLRANGIEAFAWRGGTGQAFDWSMGVLGASHVMVRADQERMARSLRGNLVECEHCKEALELTDQEVIQGWFVCPACQDTNYTGDSVTCMSCGSRLHLDEAEREQGWYRCPECDQLKQMAAQNKFVECGHCEESLELTDQEAIQGWFVCRTCQGMGYLGEPVTCLSCGNRRDLDEAEWQQGCYRCPECDQLTHLTDKYDEDEDPAPELLVEENCVDWVHLKKVTSTEEATQVVFYLRTNGIEAHAWYEAKAGRVSGSSAGKLHASHIMVPEDQIELAHSLLAKETDITFDSTEP